VATVIHIKNSKNNDNEVYIGRPGKGKEGPFGNPIIINKPCAECGSIHRSGGSTLDCYAKYLKRRVLNDSEFACKVAKLSDKTLVCFCKPAPCHGDVLKMVAEELAELGKK